MYIFFQERCSAAALYVKIHMHGDDRTMLFKCGYIYGLPCCRNARCYYIIGFEKSFFPIVFLVYGNVQTIYKINIKKKTMAIIYYANEKTLFDL